MARKDIDWLEVRIQFVQGVEQEDGSRTWPTITDLAKMYNLNTATMYAKSSKERWTEQRTEYQGSLELAKRQARVTDVRKKAQDLDESAYRISKLGAAIVTRRLAEIAEDQTLHAQTRKEAIDRVKAGGILDAEALASSIDARELDALSKAGMAFMQLGQKALGTDINRVEISGNPEEPIQHQHSIREELVRPDDDRLAAFLQVLDRSVGIENVLSIGSDDSEDIYDADIVEET